MNPTKKFWYDENSEPPKNYIWVKNDKQYEFSVSERRWKENGSSDGSEGSETLLSILNKISIKEDFFEKAAAAYSSGEQITNSSSQFYKYIKTSLTADDMFNDYNNSIKQVIATDFSNQQFLAFLISGRELSYREGYWKLIDRDSTGRWNYAITEAGLLINHESTIS